MDDEIEKNFKKKNTIYTLYNKSNTFNSNLLINNLKTQILKENELENIKIINENNEINPLEEKNYYEKSINTNNQLFKNYTQQICNICDFLKPSNKFILLENCNHTFSKVVKPNSSVTNAKMCSGINMTYEEARKKAYNI